MRQDFLKSLSRVCQMLTLTTLFFFILNKSNGQCPIIEGAMVNSCGVNEGNNEFLVFTTTAATTVGNYTLYYGNTNNPKNSPLAILAGIDARTKNTSATITANGCSVVSVTSSSTIIPANNRVIFIPSDFDQSYDVSAFCNGTSIYVVYINISITSTVSSWAAGSSGNFGNSPSSDRYLQLINSSNNCASSIRSYTNGWSSNADGNFVSWNTTGTATYTNSGSCTILPPIVAPTITPQPALSVCPGVTTTTIDFVTTGSPNQYSLTWNAAALSAGFVNVTNATLPTSSLTITIPSGATAAIYTASLIVTNTTTSVSSVAQNVTVTVNAKPIITAQPSSSQQTICQNATAAPLTVVATAGSGIISGYQWYRNAVSSNTSGTAISGATSATYTPPTSTVGTTYYYCIVTNSNGCSTTSNVSGAIVVNALPTVNIIPANQTLCINSIATAFTIASSATTLTAYQWYSNVSNSNIGGTVVAGATSTSYTPLTTTAGTYYYYLVVTNSNGCTANSNVITIVVNSQPLVPTILKTDPTCVSSGSITVTNPVGAGFTYSIDGTNFQVSPSFTSGISSGNYTVTVKNSSGCINSSTATINPVATAPATPIFTVTQPTCSVATGSISIATVSGITYSIDGINFFSTPSFVNLVPNTYTITAKNAGGCISTVNAVVNAQPLTPPAPTLIVVDNCGNSTITASGVTGTLVWSDAGTGNPRTVTTAASYTVTQTLNGCTSVASNSVTSAPKTIPSAPTLAVVDNCGNSTITASGVTGTLVWSDAGTGNPRTVTTAASYTVTQTINGCTSAVSNSVTSAPKTIPSAPTLAVVDNCGNSTITASGVTGTLVWSDAGTGNPRTVTTAASYTVTQTINGCTSAASNSVTSAPKTIPSAPTLAVVDNCGNSTITASGVTGTLTWSDAGTGNPRTVNTAASYTATQTINGCTSAASNSVTSTPKTIPSAPILSVVDNCGNSTITASGVTGTLVWSDAGTGNPRSVTTAASYTVTQTINGCTSAASNSVTSAPKAIPSAPTVTTPVTYCQNAIATALAATGINLQWYGTAATGGTASGTAPTPVTTAGGSTNYYVSQTVGGCESPRAAVNVVVIATPAPTVVSPITFCLNATATALTATGTNLLWYGTAAIGGTSSITAPTPLTNTAGNTIYYVSQTVNGCESPRAAIAVTVESFTITLSANPNPAFGGVTFTGQITGNLPIASSVWQPSNLFVNNLSTQTIVAPDTSFTLIVTGVSANGCRSTSSKLVTVIPSNNSIFIPNALTPAAVGTDASVIKVYGTTVKTAQLLVYNQWGQLIFTTDSATTKGWDGTFNGKAQPSGTYTYVVRVVYQNNKVETKSGSINLIR